MPSPWAWAPTCTRGGTSTCRTLSTAAPAVTTCSTIATSLEPASSTRFRATTRATGMRPRALGGASMKTLIRMAAAGLLFAPLAFGAVTPQEAAHLGEDLTPLGGEKAANADGSIPAWTGGITLGGGGGLSQLQVRGPSPRSVRERQAALHDHPREPRAVRREAHRRAQGALQDLRDYKMIVYPTHRSAAVPDQRRRGHQAHRHHRQSRCRAATASPAAIGGTPFPIPKSGLEVYWNHLLRYRGVAAALQVGQVAPHRRRQLHGRQLQGGVLLPVLRDRA